MTYLRKPPNGEKPADTIKFQETVIRNLEKRCDELVLERGKGAGQVEQLETQLRNMKEDRDNWRNQVGSLQQDLRRADCELNRMNGYIQRVHVVEGKRELPSFPTSHYEIEPFRSEVDSLRDVMMPPRGGR